VASAKSNVVNVAPPELLSGVSFRDPGSLRAGPVGWGSPSHGCRRRLAEPSDARSPPPPTASAELRKLPADVAWQSLPEFLPNRPAGLLPSAPSVPQTRRATARSASRNGPPTGSRGFQTPRSALESCRFRQNASLREWSTAATGAEHPSGRTHIRGTTA